MLLSWRAFSAKIRRRESPFYDRLYSIAKNIHGVSFPVHKKFHGFLYDEWALRTNMWHEFWRIVYFEPIFKSQCAEVGSGFRMEYAGNGTTRVYGNLQIYIGDNVTIFDNTGLVGLKVKDKPELHIGNNTYIGPSVRIYIGSKVSIGSHCMITSRLVTDNPGHPIDDVLARMESSGGAPRESSIRPISIGDFCFLALDTYVYPGTTVGDGVVAKMGTHINGNIPPFCLISGNPWRVDKKLPIPDALKDRFGEERYRQWKEQQDTVKLD